MRTKLHPEQRRLRGGEAPPSASSDTSVYRQLRWTDGCFVLKTNHTDRTALQMLARNLQRTRDRMGLWGIQLLKLRLGAETPTGS